MENTIENAQKWIDGCFGSRYNLDKTPLFQILYDYAKSTEQLNKPCVSNRREQLIDFLLWLEEEPQKEMVEKIVDHYLESN